MKIFGITSITLLLVLSSINSHAQSGNSYFESLDTLYSEGTLPQVEKISNVLWHGRCFEPSKPNTPFSAALVFPRKENGSYQYQSFGGPHTPATHFDYETFHSLVDQYKDYENTWGDLRVNKDYLEGGEYDVFGGFSKSNFRMAGDYIISKRFSAEIDESFGPLKLYRLNAICYHFRNSTR